jgi:hypothetical protein
LVKRLPYTTTNFRIFLINNILRERSNERYIYVVRVQVENILKATGFIPIEQENRKDSDQQRGHATATVYQTLTGLDGCNDDSSQVKYRQYIETEHNPLQKSAVEESHPPFGTHDTTLRLLVHGDNEKA